MTTDKLTDEQVQQLRDNVLAIPPNELESRIAKVCDQLLRLRAGVARAKELRDEVSTVTSLTNAATVAALDEILKGFEP